MSTRHDMDTLSVLTYPHHYGDVIMGAIASQITSLAIVYSTVYSDANPRKHQSSASLAFVWGIHRGPVNSPHKWPVTQKMFPFDDVIMTKSQYNALFWWFLVCYTEQSVHQTFALPGIRNTMTLVWHHCNAVKDTGLTGQRDRASCTHRQREASLMPAHAYCPVSIFSL